MPARTFDIVVVGRGPVGLAAAAFAEQLGMSVAIVEKHRDLYALPRAGHVDHEIVRLFQSVGVASAMLEDSYPTTEYVWVNADGETIMEFDWGSKGISGYNSDYMQFQPVFENALIERVAGSSLVEQFLGWEAQTFDEQPDAAVVGLAKTIMVPGQIRPVATDEKQTIRARYVIAADGANSGVRAKLGVERDDFGFNEKWLVVDARKKREISFDFDCGQICDPKRPITVLPLGKRHRRWEWAMLPGESVAELESPEMAWKLLAEQNITPDDVEIIRRLVYTFEARHARGWRRGRIFLAGDAAHTMPPFMGQGMCSGLRDAKNLAWKLDLVLRGVAHPSLLDTYEGERSPHTRDWTLISLEAGKVPCTLDPVQARLRDERFRCGWKPPMPNFPKLDDGVLSFGPNGKPAGLAGTLSLQAKIAKNGSAELFDQFFPSTGFIVISTKANPATGLSGRQTKALQRIGTHFVHVGSDAGADAIDVDGAYAAYFAEHGIEAIIHRPDFYVFGAAARLTDLPGLVDELLQRLDYIEVTNADVGKKNRTGQQDAVA
ncbi:bifunctional 3-(3-hydroxy-phenyl)propionate/3-hydroxycinnamic acid hydroxylase [Mesorhizobium qingshengii]|uniref:Bifunctional 3-(3-hydroxy-phenyl)propionate/3-hydroxycinnamic acid hydroxylase n=1 Tax=Mesorhizobium qingshengii TaxID=1165689 RepID=A0ABT4R3U2_9HYPH|nr:bifunctional 3-(3-hydroxy-phenyl)propionate/3-hydroxycinnamic acid hydroxylase [Mesorhizobium qingshengii]MCZ8548508.1 bifunctional 3-(3-hydroxy-phenyl)propionate/3-hydroxycinnamic acid hydroxylase [Mesorhizobium qingshengii]